MSRRRARRSKRGKEVVMENLQRLGVSVVKKAKKQETCWRCKKHRATHHIGAFRYCDQCFAVVADRQAALEATRSVGLDLLK
jgi:hypothetical protein